MEPYTPEEPYNVISEELEKLSGLESSSAEFNVTRNYLDWLTSLPWEKQSKERLDLVHAKTVSALLKNYYNRQKTSVLRRKQRMHEQPCIVLHTAWTEETS